MLSWSPFPFLRIVFFFIGGILSGIFIPDFISIDIACIIFGVLSAVFILIAFLRSKGKLKNINPGFIGLAIIVLIGYIQAGHHTESNRASHLINCTDTVAQYSVSLTSQPLEKENSWKAEAEVEWVRFDNGDWRRQSGKVLLYFSKQDFKKAFRYGDKFLLAGSPSLIKGPVNPGEFDFRKFSAYRSIYYQHFLKSRSVLLIGHEPRSLLIDYSIRARVWADQILKKYIEGAREQTTTSALVLGLMEGLDNDLIGAYAATGSLHVLSVSGLHVGIIYWLMLTLLRPLEKTVRGKWILATLSVLALWAYAFVTGLSPSVLRAVTMFSFVAIAKPWNQRTNIYNTLAVSACCLLFYDPYLIMSVGFQLSYLAVIGIVYLQPLLSQFWQPRRWLWNQIWQVLCVSVAAQLATIAIGLLYFHQFPVYFLVANLFVIPASFIVLILGIVLIVVGLFAPIASVVGVVIMWVVKILNGGVILMEKLPFSLIDNVNITTLQCWTLMAMIASVVLMFERRAFFAGVIASFCMVLFSLIHWNYFIYESGKTTLAVYSISGHSALDIIEESEAYFFTDSSLVNNPSKIRFHVRPFRLQRSVEHVSSGDEAEFVSSLKGCRLIVWGNQIILQIRKNDFLIPSFIDPDYIIIANNAIKSVNDISRFKSSKLILDSSNSVYFANRILKEARNESMEVYSVLHQGAFIANLNKK